jgi:hypothetical protein
MDDGVDNRLTVSDAHGGKCGCSGTGDEPELAISKRRYFSTLYGITKYKCSGAQPDNEITE